MAIKYYYRMHEKCGSSNSIENITNKNCLKNFIKGISNIDNLIINIDNSSDTFAEEIKKIHPHITTSNCGNGFSFLKTVDEAILQNSDEDIIYFVEAGPLVISFCCVIRRDPRFIVSSSCRRSLVAYGMLM